MSETTPTLIDRVREPGRVRERLLDAARWVRGNPKRTILTGAGLAAVVLTVSGLVLSRSTDAMLLAAVSEGPFEVKIVETGTLQALRSVTYS